MKPTIKPKQQTTYHRDGSVSLWNVMAQQWERKSATHIPAAVLSTMSQTERDRIAKMAGPPSRSARNKAIVIFDNGGGITLQLHSGSTKTWAHHYDSPRAAVSNLYDFFAHGNTEGWEGHEDEAAACEPTPEEIRNGGYIVADYGSWQEVADDTTGFGWGNVQHFEAVVADLDMQ